MVGNLAGFLKFDPLLAAAIILAVTLLLGRAVDLVRERRRKKEDAAHESQMRIAKNFKPSEISDAADS
jgi:uncharacterized membrane protein